MLDILLLVKLFRVLGFCGGLRYYRGTAVEGIDFVTLGQ